MDEDGIGALIGLVIILAIVAFVIYCIVMLAGIIASVAGAGGLLWGGGTAIANYGKSFKENMVDSNRATA
ncbi:hypothetical protein [Ruminococcus flavefaciens]|uniref:Uncharacterized protein n=1 Tax=Ruminococcus flavefaciens TaxID=1265 RepID=A0A1M7HTG2_RUMFL|nr:hypothetical protein [Ruminococcus flavefaciens]SHM31679.1 hypothetical protein SAMN04487860_10380 [Ruminococcus flavefaciens]